MTRQVESGSKRGMAEALRKPHPGQLGILEPILPMIRPPGGNGKTITCHAALFQVGQPFRKSAQFGEMWAEALALCRRLFSPRGSRRSHCPAIGLLDWLNT